MGLLGALLLVFLVYVRPQEFIPALDALPLLNGVVALAVVGISAELAMGRTSSAWSPQVPFALALLAWCYLVTLICVGRDGLEHTNRSILFSALFMSIVMYGARSYSRLRAIAAFLLGIALFLGVVSSYQSLGQKECILLDMSTPDADGTRGTPDGRACEAGYLCEKEAEAAGGDPSAQYACERMGLFGTFTIEGRVRWRGTLGDPNELALSLGAAIAFAFAFHATTRSVLRHLVLAVALAVTLYSVVLTGSRGGVLVMLTVFGVYFVRRYGAKGIVLGAVFALPILLFGGRGGAQADASTLERLDLLYRGMDLIREHPLVGVGQGQFIEHSLGRLTAHNSYVLSAAELGVPGMLLWTMLVYVSIKIPFVVATRPPPGIDPRLVPFATALVVSYAGILVGVFFLSFCYHPMLFIYFGLSGALFGAVKQRCPEFRLAIVPKEAFVLAGVDVALLVVLFVYTRLKGAA